MKRLENKKLEKFLAVLVEALEFTFIMCISVNLLHVSLKDSLIILLVFFITKFSIGQHKHYKIVEYFDSGWRRCFFWTTALILSMAMTSKMGLFIGILFTIFTTFIISGRADIEDLTMGYKTRKEDGKYYDIEEYIKYNLVNSRLIEFEENLKRTDDLLYLIYKYRFKDHLSFSKISERLNYMENVRIVEKLDQIALAIRIHCGI